MPIEQTMFFILQTSFSEFENRLLYDLLKQYTVHYNYDVCLLLYKYIYIYMDIDIDNYMHV